MFLYYFTVLGWSVYKQINLQLSEIHLFQMYLIFWSISTQLKQLFSRESEFFITSKQNTLQHSGTQNNTIQTLVYFELPSFSQYTIKLAFFFVCIYCLISKIFWWQNITSVFKTSTTYNSSNWPGSNHTTSSAFVLHSINGGGGQKSYHVFLETLLVILMLFQPVSSNLA